MRVHVTVRDVLPGRTGLHWGFARVAGEGAEEGHQHEHDRGRGEGDHPGPDRAELGELGTEQLGEPVTADRLTGTIRRARGGRSS